MKKTRINIIISLIISFLSIAQMTAQVEWDVPETNMGLITKSTSQGCSPCGKWGWDAMKGILDTHGDDNIVISVHATHFSLGSEYARELVAELGTLSTPNFAGNGLADGTNYSSALSIVDTFKMTTVVANAAYEIENVTDSTIVILVKAKFFENFEGEFSLKNFVVEDNVLGNQSGQTGEVAHHKVLREKFGPKKDTSDVFHIGTVEKDDVFTRSFIIDRPPNWDLKESYIATTLWMQNPEDSSDLLYINGSKSPMAGELKKKGGTKDAEIENDPSSWPVGLDELDEDGVFIYPNPSNHVVNVLTNAEGARSIKMFNSVGQLMIEHNCTSEAQQSIDVSDLDIGHYIMVIETDHGSITKRFLKS